MRGRGRLPTAATTNNNSEPSVPHATPLARLLPDGRVVRSDPMPPAGEAAFRRLNAAMRRGDPVGSGATALDAALVLAWTDEQERRYPTPGLARGWAW